MLHLGFLGVPSRTQTVHAWYEPIVYKKNAKWGGKPVPELVGDTVKERTDNMLKKYGYSPAMRHKIAAEQNIKTEVLVAIAWADTHLGYASKSKNNIGNVGNNDRWDTVEYPTIEAGIRAMWSSALNGKYLSKKATIGDLSCWWYYARDMECQYPVYATSAENWNVNVLNLLTAIYWEQVDETFIFRN